MLRLVLKRNISIIQMAGYALAVLVGLVIVMTAVQFYGDAGSALSKSAAGGAGIELTGKRNIIISKPVSLRNTLSGTAPSFSDAEIEALRSQPWAGTVSGLKASDYGVWAGVELGGRTLSTALFFESVPDRLLDIPADDWSFDPEHPSVPIIISKDYLTLYNFGFAATGRMPAISEGMLSQIPIVVTLSGNGHTATLPARIVGFSSWLNTIAVPETFMDWAHSRFGTSDGREQPSRLIIETSDPTDPAIEKYLAAEAYDVAGPGDGGMGRASRFVVILATVVSTVGVIITLLALGILVLSLYLLVQKNSRAISGLMLLGYSPGQITSCYFRMVAAINAGVTLAACGALLLLRRLWQEPMTEIDMPPVSPLAAIVTGVTVMLVVTAVNYGVIRRLVRRVWLGKC